MNWLIEQILEDLENELNEQDVRYFIFGLETELSKNMLTDGVIMVKPISSGISAVTTGITDEEVHEVEIILARNVQTKVYKSTQETGDQYLTKVMDGRDSCNNPLKNTVRYIIRSHMQDYGLRQPEISITYNDERIEGVTTATMRITQENHYSQPI